MASSTETKCFRHSGYHAVGKGRYLGLGLAVARLVAHLEGNDVRVFAVELLGVIIAVVEKLRQVILLRPNGPRIGVGLHLKINLGLTQKV